MLVCYQNFEKFLQGRGLCSKPKATSTVGFTKIAQFRHYQKNMNRIYAHNLMTSDAESVFFLLNN